MAIAFAFRSQVGPTPFLGSRLGWAQLGPESIGPSRTRRKSEGNYGSTTTTLRSVLLYPHRRDTTPPPPYPRRRPPPPPSAAALGPPDARVTSHGKAPRLRLLDPARFRCGAGAPMVRLGQVRLDAGMDADAGAGSVGCRVGNGM